MKMENKENIRTMEFIQLDGFNRPVYKCLETKVLYKDTTLGSGKPELYSCYNQIEGEPDCPIKKTLKIVFLNQYFEDKFKFEYMMLDRMRSDCDYFLGHGNRSLKRITNNNVVDHIAEMKRLYCLLPLKPNWLTMERIKQYEFDMI